MYHGATKTPILEYFSGCNNVMLSPYFAQCTWLLYETKLMYLFVSVFTIFMRKITKYAHITNNAIRDPDARLRSGQERQVVDREPAPVHDSGARPRAGRAYVPLDRRDIREELAERAEYHHQRHY